LSIVIIVDRTFVHHLVIIQLKLTNIQLLLQFLDLKMVLIHNILLLNIILYLLIMVFIERHII